MNIPNEVSAQCVWAGAVLPHTKTQEKKMLEATFSGKSSFLAYTANIVL